MSLNKPAFESQQATDTAAVEDTSAAAGAAQVSTAAQSNEGQQAADQQSTTTALATAATSALAVPRNGDRKELLAQADVIGQLKGALPVTWEDFTPINANQGQFQIKGETAKQIGQYIELKLVSHQDQWVIAPKDNDAEGDGLVKYSDDGVNLNDDSGQTIEEHKQFLTDKGEEPTVSHRVVLVGELTACGEAGVDEQGNLVQVILAESGRRSFQSHCKQVAYQLTQGRMRAGDAEHLKLSATLAGTGKKQYTLVKVSYADDHGPSKGGNADIIG